MQKIATILIPINAANDIKIVFSRNEKEFGNSTVVWV